MRIVIVAIVLCIGMAIVERSGGSDSYNRAIAVGMID